MSQGSFLAPKIGPKWVPNCIIDAEGVRKPLERHLGRYHSALRGILGALGRILRPVTLLEGWTTPSEPPTALRAGALGPYIRDS